MRRVESRMSNRQSGARARRARTMTLNHEGGVKAYYLG
jgi:hypothetical protein